MFTVPAAIRRISGPPPISAPIFTGPVVIPAQTVDTAFSWDMSQYFSGDAVVSYALTSDGGQAWLSINTSTGELSGQTPATPVSVTGVNVTATNTGGSTPTGAFGFEVEAASGYGDALVFEFRIPLDGDTASFNVNFSGTYSGEVDWGDGNVLPVTARGDLESHAYATAGDYIAKFTGTYTYMRNTPADFISRLLKVHNLGSTGLTVLGRAFRDCQVLNEFHSGTCDTSASNNFSSMFQNTDNIAVFDISTMDTSSSTTFGYMFGYNADPFASVARGDDLLIPLVNNMGFMCSSTAMTTANYDAMLINFASQAPDIQPDVILTGSTGNYSSAAQASRDLLTSAPHNWTINDGGLE